MKRLGVLSRKGGSGKSTLAVHLAVAAVSAGERVVVIDLDPQASAVKWSARRSVSWPVVLSADASVLGSVLEAAALRGVSLCIFDTAPHSASAALDAAKCSDLVVIPSRPSIFDLEAVGDTLAIASRAGVPVRVVFNGVKPWGRVLRQAKSALEVYDVVCAPCGLGDRVAFSYAVVAGATAQEYEPRGKASGEVAAVYGYLWRVLEEV